ncbi:hypothetical protein ALP92_04595 [Pseudomonas syringae pv. primulae]|uniref:Uncharacterized protein n=1 Tax=Pseudomonas syringae pv. primulae TaxID=251707 RepID=A0A3M4SFL1_9PSED|nr:hypothetical protein ALP92_04595 [Pseudomonas syringae pv. primulae]
MESKGMAPILPEQAICGEKSMGWQQPSGQRDQAFPPFDRTVTADRIKTV